MPSISIVFNRNNRKNKSGLYSIDIRVIQDRKIKYYPVGVKVDKKHWRGKDNQWISDSHPYGYEINTKIRKKKATIEEYTHKLFMEDRIITIDKITDYLEKGDAAHIFNDYAEDFISNHIKGKKAYRTWQKYHTFLKNLNDFNPTIPFRDLNEKLFFEFRDYLFHDRGQKGVTVDKAFQQFKVIVRGAVREDFLPADPFQYLNLGIEKTRNPRSFLSVEEIKQLRSVSLPEDRSNLERTREQWLFCFYVGFYLSDLYSLTWEHIKETKRGYIIEGFRSKNGKPYLGFIYKFRHAQEIIMKQKGLNEHLVFPEQISEPVFNRQLKDLAQLAGLDKSLNNKMARHSFQQFITAQKGLAPQYSKYLAGHSDEKMTENYYEVGRKELEPQLEMIDTSDFD
ncbi:MAG: site-specific integrase [Bacteroidota bacterium]